MIPMMKYGQHRNTKGQGAQELAYSLAFHVGSRLAAVRTILKKKDEIF